MYLEQLQMFTFRAALIINNNTENTTRNSCLSPQQGSAWEMGWHGMSSPRFTLSVASALKIVEGIPAKQIKFVH